MIEEKNRKRRIDNIKKPLLVNLSKLLDGYQITDDNETPHLRRKPIAIRNIKDDETPKSLRRKPIITIIENRH